MNLLTKFCLFSILTVYCHDVFSQNPTDCINAVVACGNSNISLDVNGVGTQELSGSNSCSGRENNSIWLKVTLVTSGTLGFTLTPNSADISEDYDFFVFGPNVSCGDIGQAIRCSTTNPQNAGQRNNLTGMNSSSRDTAEGPGSDGNSFVKSLDVLAGETYYIVIDRPIGNSPFSLEWTGTATFSDPPTDESTTSGTPLELEKCDIETPFDDGFTSFNLIDNTSAIRGSQTDVTITYHESASDANIGTNELMSPYRNISNPQTIYARITNNSTECFELAEFDINVNSGPNYTAPSDFILCDNLDDGDGKNGLTTFNLSSKNNEILNGQDPLDFNITFHKLQTDAEAGVNTLLNIYPNETAFNEQIFVRIEDKLNTNCKSITPLNLVVNPQPDAFDHNILQCDEDGYPDGFTSFNLNEASDDLTGNTANRSVKFYKDPARTVEIPGSSFNNTSNPQTIYIEVINDDTSCSAHSELTLGVSTTDVNDASLTPVCDDDGIEDGFHDFNLSDANDDILNGLPPGLTIFYYETYNDVLLEQNVLGTSFTNTIRYSQTIYARVENANDCYGISEVLLTVNELPEIDTEDLTYFYCLNEAPETIPINPRISNNLQSDYIYSWSTGETSYQIRVNEIKNYAVTVTNANGCSKQRTIIVQPSNIATVQEINVVDASQNNTITIIASGEGEYEYRLIDENNTVVFPYQESNVFENVFPGIYTVTVNDVKNDCGLTNDKTYVIGFPKFFTPNNDGRHDTWQVYGVSNMFQPNTKIRIFNRYGKLITQITPIGEGWDGTINGEMLPVDDYWFAIELQDGRIFKNHFTLKY